MAPGVLDILTVVDPDLVDPKGIAWVKQEIKRRCAVQGVEYSYLHWRKFWTYFRKTWLKRYFITEWNVFGIANSVVVRTNNPLERFNREMNAAMKPHPRLRHFVATIAKMSTAYAQRQSSITRGLRRKKQRPPRIQLPASPDLAAFDVPADSDEDADREEELSDALIDSDGSEDAGLPSEDDVTPVGMETAKDLETEIAGHANAYDFSLDFPGDDGSDELSDSEGEQV
jgi:hypothetical protein